ncbi:unnamed protein product [Brassica oleracea var. botrytis]
MMSELGRAELRFWLIDLFGISGKRGTRRRGILIDCVVTDLLSHQVVRCFEDNDIYHVGGKVNPTSGLDFINLKLIFCDLDQICKILERLTKCKARGFTI